MAEETTETPRTTAASTTSTTEEAATTADGWTPYLSSEAAPQGHVVELEPCETRDKPCHLYVTGVDIEVEVTDKLNSNSWKTKPVVLMIHDIFGPNSGRHRQLADEWAKRIEGVVVLADCYQGNGLVQEASDESQQQQQQQQQPPRRMGFNLFTAKTLWKYASGGATAFLKEYPFGTDLFPLLKDQLLPFLNKKQVEKFGMVGFSWGSWVVMKACADPELSKYISCACHFHPSIKATETMWGGDDLHLCRRVSCPQYFLVTKLEPKEWWPAGDAEDTLMRNKNIPYGSVEFSISPTEIHGFMTRGSTILDKESTVAEIERGVKTSTKFLLKYLNSGKK
jgi:dienelactone hydrolase